MSLENGAAPAAETVATQAPASELQPQAVTPVADGGAEVNAGEQGQPRENQPPEGQETQEQASKKRERFDRRFSELSRAAREAELRAARLEGELNALRTSQRPQEQPTPQAPAKPAGPPDPKNYPQGEFDPRYAADLAKHEIREEQRVEAERAAAAERQAAERAAAMQGFERLETTIDRAYEVAEGEQGQYFQNAPRFLEFAKANLPRQTVDLITKSEYPVHVAEVFGRDVQRVRDLMSMSPLDQAAFIGDLSAQIRANVKPTQRATPAPSAQPAPSHQSAPTPSPAPIPTAPAGGGAPQFNPETASPAEVQARLEQLQKTRASSWGG